MTAWDEKVISLLVPTRERPEELFRMMDSAVKTANVHALLEFVVWVDDDDESHLTFPAHANVKVIHGPRTVLSMCWNFCWHAASGEVFGHLGDDVIFRTEGWDAMLLAEMGNYDDGIVFVHGADGIQNERLGTHGFVTKEWTDTLGYFVPPYFASDYNDTWLNELADRVGRRRYLPQLFTEHMHYSVGKSEKDQNTIDRLERHAQQNPEGLWVATRRQRELDAQKLREAML